MTDDQIRDLIRHRALPHAKLRGSTGVTAWAIANGVERGGLCRFMTGKRGPGADVLRVLGLEWRLTRDESAWIGSGNAPVSEEEVRDLVRRLAAAYATPWVRSTGVTAWGMARGLQKSMLSLFMAGKAAPGADLLSVLGLKWQIVPVGSDGAQEAVSAL